MKLIQPFADLIQAGVTLTLKFSAAGATNIQLDILPQGKDTKTGVSLPPKAIVGTAQELDENLEAFIAKYAPSVQRVAEVVAGADADLQKIESDAAAQAKKAVDEKAKSRAAAKPGAGKSSTPAPKKDLTKGMLDEGAGGSNDDNDDDDPDGGAAGDVAATTLLTTGQGAAPATAAKPAAAPAAGLDESLF
jgi:PRTRC genetic system protein E